MALIRQTGLFLGVAALAGVGWTLSASELWVAAQRSMPGWARGRMNATVIMVSQGAMALGGVIWGCAATKAGAGYTLLGAAFLFLISLVLAAPLSINFTGMLNFDLAPVTSFFHRLVYTPQPRDGPMSITLEFKIDCARAPEFLSLMREVRLIHLRNGAYGWRLHEDLTRSNTFRLEFVVRSWNEHLLQRERITKAEKDVLEKVWSLHMSASPPEERIYLAISNGLYTPRQCTFNASIPSTRPPHFEIQEIQGRDVNVRV